MRDWEGGLSTVFSATFVELICDLLCLTQKVVADYDLFHQFARLLPANEEK
jgi:hypothetical protein